MDEGSERRSLRKGSLTVEAAYIVPAAVFVIALLLVLQFFVHNRNYYTAAALEAALLGNGRAVKDTCELEGEAAERARDRSSEQPFPGSRPGSAVRCTRTGTSVSYSGQHFPAFDRWFSWEIDKTVKKVRPVRILRKLHTLRQITGS